MSYQFNRLPVEKIENYSLPYLNAFKRYGIVGFKKAYYSQPEAARIAQVIGRQMGWRVSKPGNKQGGNWEYQQNHDKVVAAREAHGDNSKSAQVIEWHIEGPAKTHSQVAAGWNMHTFTGTSDTGQTGFVDMSKLWDETPDRFKALISKATIIHNPNWENEISNYHGFLADVLNGKHHIWIRDGDIYRSTTSRQAVTKDFNTGKTCLRVCPCCATHGFQDHLLLVDGELPSDSQRALFSDFLEWERSEITLNQGRQLWWSWDEGDFLIVNLHGYAHGVRGGFKPGSRTLTGMWAYPVDVEEPEDPLLNEEQYLSLCLDV
jgi:alpha-ketoglutarate-dependent taurine dioxygenase